MKKPLAERVAKSAAVLFLELVVQIVMVPLFAGYALGYLWIFDRVGISNPDTQLAWVLAPMVLGGLVVMVCLIRKNRGR